MSTPGPAQSDHVVPRDASTTMVVRDTDDGLEVLMLRRNLASAWASGIHLFPGGAVDEADGDPRLLARCLGPTDEEASATLGVSSGGLRWFVAAVRECFEESGILFASRPDGALALGARVSEARRKLNAGEISFVGLVETEDLRLLAGELCYFSHWITPEGSSRRYDTRFFVARKPDGQDALHDERETIESRFVRPSHALELFRNEELELWPPTEKNLEALARFENVDTLLAAVEDAGPMATVEPRRVGEGEGSRILLPGDDGYDKAR